MVQSPSWAADRLAAGQEIPRISRNPKVHHRTHKRTPTVSILGQPNPVHMPTTHLLEIHPNIIHPSTPRSPQWSLSLRFPHQDPIHPPLLTHTRHMPSPSHSSWFYHPHNIGWGVQIITVLIGKIYLCLTVRVTHKILCYWTNTTGMTHLKIVSEVINIVSSYRNPLHSRHVGILGTNIPTTAWGWVVNCGGIFVFWTNDIKSRNFLSWCKYWLPRCKRSSTNNGCGGCYCSHQ